MDKKVNEPKNCVPVLISINNANINIGCSQPVPTTEKDNKGGEEERRVYKTYPNSNLIDMSEFFAQKQKENSAEEEADVWSELERLFKMLFREEGQ